MTNRKAKLLRDALVLMELPDNEEQPRKGWFLLQTIRLQEWHETKQIIGIAEYKTSLGWLKESRENLPCTRQVFASLENNHWRRVSMEQLEKLLPDTLSSATYTFDPWDASFPT